MQEEEAALIAGLVFAESLVHRERLAPSFAIPPRV